MSCQNPVFILLGPRTPLSPLLPTSSHLLQQQYSLSTSYPVNCNIKMPDATDRPTATVMNNSTDPPGSPSRVPTLTPAMARAIVNMLGDLTEPASPTGMSETPLSNNTTLVGGEEDEEEDEEEEDGNSTALNSDAIPTSDSDSDISDCDIGSPLIVGEDEGRVEPGEDGKEGEDGAEEEADEEDYQGHEEEAEDGTKD
ncbi:hypothetical protein CALCODRAFT_93014 [Calocera cornea HHB12733]|uniref:Uncharacterized protein n=1 Tax=Calocera cornea HHB12733 TaxID=1353952 RepID=A0A165D985_9BASI|nr:hypothetical protein CALCODRAFT_93014 [Calocera cornea HHB12733]